MFRGACINTTERCAVLHTALGAPADEHSVLDDVDVVAEVQSVLLRVAAFSQGIRSGH